MGLLSPHPQARLLITYRLPGQSFPQERAFLRSRLLVLFVLPRHATVEFYIKDADFRTVSASADFHEVRNVERVKISESTGISLPLLFDPEHNLEERILKEQFQP